MENNEASKGPESKGPKPQGQSHFGNNGSKNSSGGNRGGNSANNGGKLFIKGHNQGKAGKPCREIYRPPSLRSKSSRNGGNSSTGGNESSPETHEICKTEPIIGETATVEDNASKTPGSNVNAAYNVNSHKPHASGGSGSVPNSPLITRHVFNFNNLNQQTGKSLNANAKEFQFVPNQQQLQNQQLANLLSQLDPCFYGDAAGALLASSGVYSLQQSKSLGNNMNLFLQQQLQAASSRQMSYANQSSMVLPYHMDPVGVLGFGYNGGRNAQPQPQLQKPSYMDRQAQDPQSPFNRLTQSRSSGSIPASSSRPRVRFDDEDSDDEANRNTMKNAESVFASMKLNSEAFMENSQQAPKSPVMPPKQLQKSRTGFYLNMYTPQTQSPPMLNPSYLQQGQGILKPTQTQPVPQNKTLFQSQPSVKRSRSFGSGSVNQTQTPAFLGPIHSVYSDFQISKWPRRVQESITSAVTAVERVAARQQIEMVNLIFEEMLRAFESSKTEDNGKSTEVSWRSQETDEDSSDLSSAAVHIFLYFIQREKDRTVMESLLNTCFATFQQLFGSGQPKTSTEIIAGHCNIFLKFLSSLYSQVKLIRRQNSRQQGQTMDEMSFTLLALLCDSCLATLRSRLCNEPSLMGCLFTVMTSQGRDMEETFPLKMKQLLAAVRDALLGLGPYSKGPMSAMVQKTLMQLIELHAANWQLPASAVRYYYTNNSNATERNKTPSGSFGSNFNS